MKGYSFSELVALAEAALPATATAVAAHKLHTARTIGGVAFDGTTNINLPGVNTTGNQNTTGSSASCTGNAATATKLQTARKINGKAFDGTADITLGSSDVGAAPLSHTHTPAQVGLGALSVADSTLNIDGQSGATQQVVDFRTVKTRLIVEAVRQGIYRPDNGWRWCWDDGVLTIGTVPWARLSGQPETATRWPSWTEVTDKPSTMPPSSHTHPWSQVTGVPVQATRWPTWTEVTDKPSTMPPSSHTHPWSEITGAPVYTTRWPTLAEIGAQPAGSYAAASHTHPWSQVTGVPVQATRWPTFDEVTGKPTNYATNWGSVADKPATATRWPTPAEVGAQPAGSYAAASHPHTIADITSLQTSLDSKQEIDTQRGALVAARYLSSSISAVGTKIRLPFLTNAGRMVCFTVRVYQNYQTTDVLFSGYLYSATNQWHAPNAIVSAGSTRLNVKMGRDADGRAYVWLQGSDYRGVAVLDVVGGYAAANWNTGWEISESDTVPNVALDTTIYPPYSPNNKPTPADIGAQPAGSYAAASHTHPWAQVTGVPVQATRWPTWTEVTDKPSTMPPSSHTHPWAQITGAPVYTTRWPTPAEVGAQPAGSYAAASHRHPWSDLDGVPATASRWPNATEVGLSNYKNASDATYGSVTINGSKSGYAGIHFPTADRVMMVGDTSKASGVYDTVAGKWDWYFQNGSLVEGSIPWARLTGVPVQATRWPNSTEVGLGNVPNTVHTTESTASTVAVRDSAGQLSATKFLGAFKGSGAELTSVPWAALTSVPAYAARWPNAVEVGLSNVPNTVHTTADTANTVAVRDGTGQLSATKFLGAFKGSGAELTSVPWAALTSVPAYAARWPNAVEVGLGNVPNTVHTAAATANTVAVRDVNGDLVARQMHAQQFNGSGSGLTNLQWARLVGVPATASRWPTLAEIGAAADSHSHNVGRNYTELFSPPPGGITAGNFTLSQAYSDFDGLIIITSGDDGAFFQSAEIASFTIDQLAALSGTKNYHIIAYSNYNWSGRFSADKKTFVTGPQSCKIHKIYGYRTVTL